MLRVVGLLSSSVLVPSTAYADPIILSGDYIKIGLNDVGTLGYGGNTSPGILYDGTGTATFNPAYDYLTPGSPFEGFVVTGSNGSDFTAINNNAFGGNDFVGTLTNYSGVAYGGTTYDKRAVWTGTYGGLLTLTNDYYFNSSGQQLGIKTTISALSDLTSLAFSRQLDPDAFAAPGDSSATNNFRGATGIAATNLAYAEALASKYVIGLYTASAVTHNAAITNWQQDTATYLAGTNVGDGDNAIGLGFDIGALLAGHSIVLDYSYIFGTNITAAVEAGTATPAPMPSSITASNTVEDLLDGRVNPVFAGGTLAVTTPVIVANALAIESSGGTIDTHGYDAVFSGAFSGEGGLTKIGAGTLILTGANTYSGGTTISEGRIAGSSAAIQGDIVNNAAVEFDQADDGAYAGAMSGSGGLVKTGAGTLVLSGANSYTGGTFVGAGTVTASNSAAVGSGTLTIGAARFRAGGDIVLANAVILDSAASEIDSSNFNITLAGNISGGGALNKVGSGTLTLTGANSQNGIVLSGGTLAFGSDTALGAIGSVVTIQEDTTLRTLNDFTIGHDIFVNDTQRAKFDSNGHDIVMAGNITGSGNIEKIGAGILTLAGTNRNVTINVLGGKVIAQSQGAIGSGGEITLYQGGGFTAGSDMTISQSLHIAGTNATFDTGGHNVNLTGVTDGNACLTKVGTGRLNLMAAGSNDIGACIQQGTLSFNNSFAGNVQVDQNGIAGGSGQIIGNVNVQGTLAPGNSPGRLIVAGSVTQAATSTLALDIDGTTPGIGAGHYDMLVLTGSSGVYTAGGTITPILRGITGDATNSFSPQVGQTFEVVTAEGGVQGSFSNIAQPIAGLASNTRFDVVYRNNAVILAVTPSSYADFGGGLNAVAAGRALDGLRNGTGARDTSNSGMLLSDLTGLNSNQLALTLEQLSGSIHADATDSAMQTYRSVRGAIGQHLNNGLAAGRHLWGTVNRDNIRVGADASGRGYSSNNVSTIIGFDTSVADTLVAGAAVGYGTSDVRTAGLGKSDTSHYQGMVYGALRSAGTFLNASVSFGADKSKVNRDVMLFDGKRNLTSKPKGMSYGADLEAGHRFDLGRVAFVPMAGLSYDHVDRDAFSEIGDDTVALTFQDEQRSAWQVRAGARLSTNVTMGDTVVTPFANVTVSRELGNVAAQLRPVLDGSEMRVTAASMGRTGVQAGAGLNAALSGAVSLNIGYRYNDTANARAHSVNGGVSLRW